MSKNRKRSKTRSLSSYASECLTPKELFGTPAPRLYVEPKNPDRFIGMPNLNNNLTHQFYKLINTNYTD